MKGKGLQISSFCNPIICNRIIFSCFDKIIQLWWTMPYLVEFPPLIIMTMRISHQEIRSQEKSISLYPMEKNFAHKFLANVCESRYLSIILGTTNPIIISAATNVKCVITRTRVLKCKVLMLWNLTLDIPKLDFSCFKNSFPNVAYLCFSLKKCGLNIVHILPNWNNHGRYLFRYRQHHSS